MFRVRHSPFFFCCKLVLTHALAVLLGFTGQAVAADAATIPVGDFFKVPDFSDMQLSPSGKRLAGLVASADGRMQLAVLDSGNLKDFRIVASYKRDDVIAVAWVNDDRLVYSLTDTKSTALEASYYTGGLYTVTADGAGAPRMVSNSWLLTVLRDGSNDVIVTRYKYSITGEPETSVLVRINTVTGDEKVLTTGAPAHAFGWSLDAQARPRVVTTRWDGKTTLYWKPHADDPWMQVSEWDALAPRKVNSIYVDANDRLYATALSDDPAGTTELVRIDMGAGIDRRASLFAAKDYDFVGGLVIDARGGVIGIRYLTDARATYWLDAGLKKNQERIDALLPGTINRLDCGTCEARAKILVTSTSDRQPAAYYLYDTATDRLALLTQAMPWIKPKSMAQRDMVWIKTRDGLSMPVHITRPPGVQGAAPMVVLVHGGPWIRGGEWQWDADSQFLASRGYAVVEPEFRGSDGFGWRYFKASWKQWGLAMQDDVADAAQWAIKQGYADPKRICIAGSSYGGYATLMGLIRNPELFRCGVDSFGVTDISLMYSIHWSDSSDQSERFGKPLMIGDPKADAAQLAATSPIRLAARVTQPLLMAYGGQDRRVPIEHGTQFLNAVRATNKQVEWVVYGEEGHGFRVIANEIDFWTRVEKFLDTNLKNAP